MCSSRQFREFCFVCDMLFWYERYAQGHRFTTGVRYEYRLEKIPPVPEAFCHGLKTSVRQMDLGWKSGELYPEPAAASGSISGERLLQYQQHL